MPIPADLWPNIHGLVNLAVGRERWNRQNSAIGYRYSGNWRISISFSCYVKQLCMYVLSSSFVLGLVLGVSVLVAGEGSVSADITFDF